MQDVNLSSEDFYQLRKSQMDADKRVLDAQKAQQELERLLLELERKYGLLADGKNLDPRTATTGGSGSGRRASANGKESVDALMSVGPNEAAV